MKEKLLGVLFKGFLIVFALLVGVGVWYYTLGRKPKLAVSTRITAKAGEPTTQLIAPGEVLLLVGRKATLYDIAAGTEKWSADCGPSKNPATPAVAASVAPVPAAAKMTPPPGKISDQILQARVERHMLKLRTWATQLEAKRGNLNTPLKIASFKEEEAKYNKELAAVQAEAAGLTKSPVAVAPATGYAIESKAPESQIEDSLGYERKEVFCSGPAIWIVQNRTVRMLDRANGRLVKEIGLPGKFQKVMPGPGCFYIATAGETGGQQVTRVDNKDGAAKALNISGAAGGSRFEMQGAGLPVSPTVQSQRSEFSANGAELTQLDVRLVAKKITERQALKNDSATDWNNADKNTKGGWANDAAVIAQAMSNDMQREATGGKELVDESTYEVVLRRPFNSAIPDSASIKVQGRPDVFSTTSYDLVVAGQTMMVFDHTNKKLWESKLAFPAAAPSLVDDELGGGKTAMMGTLSQPGFEDDKRLYFFDKGFLTAFDRNTGATLWRLPSVGIRKVQLDAGGLLDRSPVLYVSSGNGTAETLQYSQQAAMPTVPVIFKVDAASGKILWKQPKYQDCFVSGGNVYATLETRNAEDLVNSVFQGTKAVQTRFKLYKLSARDGQSQWEWFQTRRPLRIEADNKKVSLLFADELQILTSRAL